jgi:hypothetical protein
MKASYPLPGIMEDNSLQERDFLFMLPSFLALKQLLLPFLCLLIQFSFLVLKITLSYWQGHSSTAPPQSMVLIYWQGHSSTAPLQSVVLIYWQGHSSTAPPQSVVLIYWQGHSSTAPSQSVVLIYWQGRS